MLAPVDRTSCARVSISDGERGDLEFVGSGFSEVEEGLVSEDWGAGDAEVLTASVGFFFFFFFLSMPGRPPFSFRVPPVAAV